MKEETVKKIMQPARKVGIIGYGAYIPRYRLAAKEISHIWRDGRDMDSLLVEEISLPGPDEDVATMAIEAAQNAISRAGINAGEIRSVYVGSESHPYAAKSTGSIVAQALGIAPHTTAADFQFACKAGTEAMQAGLPIVATKVGGLPEIIQNGQNGLLVNPGKPAELAAAIMLFLADPARAADCGLKAATSAEQFTLQNTVEQTLKLYQNL